ncbi:hypothetical protein SIM91_43305 [Rhodococcus opacus]|uniref:hypothetical protein n=1 Tax=Rhodococcus opacus TaxID=37919 RepID=UPI000A907DD1|nr:hypothetical protein [Rhodococcus opacus]MDX5969992.1 hypothetical protein [Rhodococcus opacus]CAG7635009.1 hypothetical protein E143388_07663 [Rhodococcus opacus]
MDVWVKINVTCAKALAPIVRQNIQKGADLVYRAQKGKSVTAVEAALKRKFGRALGSSAIKILAECISDGHSPVITSKVSRS